MASPLAVWFRRPSAADEGLLSLCGRHYFAAAAGYVMLLRAIDDGGEFMVDLVDGWCSCPDAEAGCGHAEALRHASDAGP